jgi:hypothetical protein
MRISVFVFSVMPESCRAYFPEEATLPAASSSLFLFRGFFISDSALRVAPSNVVFIFS